MQEAGTPTFSTRKRWSALLSVVISIACVVVITVLVNYASQRYVNVRMFISGQTKLELSERTKSLLHSLTNDLELTLYYDKEDSLYSTVAALANEYRLASPRVRVRTVDYLRNPTGAQAVKGRYESVQSSKVDKDLVIFEYQDRVKIIPGSVLADYTLERLPSKDQMEFRKKPVAFKGEMVFSGVILSLMNSEPFKAYSLVGHGEHDLLSGDDKTGYLKFASLLKQNYVDVQPISLLGTNRLPTERSLLLILGPTDRIPEVEVQKVRDYLNQGGRALVLFDYRSAGEPVGLEPLLKSDWGIEVGESYLRDPANTLSGADLIARKFGNHPVVAPLLQSGMHLILPRPVSGGGTNSQPVEAVSATQLVYAGETARMADATVSSEGSQPLAVAAEKGAVKGVVTENGPARLVVVGDSLFLVNEMIDSAGNREFANLAINWLLDRSSSMGGVGPRPVSEFRILMTSGQMARMQWVLLAGLPLIVLAIGGFVYARRKS